MSVDRYMAVVKLMDSRYLRSSRCIQITCAAVWLCSLVFGIPSLVYRSFVLPVFIIMFCYGTIILHLKKHCAAAVAANPRTEARRRHSLKMVLSIIVAFVVSWLPYNIFKVITISSQLLNIVPSCEEHSWQRNGILVSCCLAFLNSCVNPFIYFLLDHHFRRRAKNLFKTCLGQSKLVQSYNSSVSFTNTGTSESFGTSGRTQLQMSE